MFNFDNIMETMEKIKRSQSVTFLDTTPTATKEEWNILGIGITNYGIEYNPQVTTEKIIIFDNATNELESNQKQAPVSQKIYKGDPCFEYANSLRDKVGSQVKTHVLDIDIWDTVEVESTTAYKAKRSNAILVPTKFLDENAVMEYTLYYNGDPTEGTVTIVDNKPVFTPTAG